MDDSETFALEYLRSLDLGEPVYEPDGNIPPDFLIDGRIAVEVRRLNQFKTLPSGRTEPLEKSAVPFTRNVQRYLAELDAGPSGESWFVFFHFSRPLDARRELRKRIETALSDFELRRARDRETYTISVAPCLDIELFRSPKPQSSFFLFGGDADEDSGGYVLEETLKSLSVCIPEKEAKVSPFKDRYSEWWLVLLNWVGFVLSTSDLKRLRQLQGFSHSWDKVILVNPLSPTFGFEL